MVPSNLLLFHSYLPFFFLFFFRTLNRFLFLGLVKNQMRFQLLLCWSVQSSFWHTQTFKHTCCFTYEMTKPARFRKVPNCCLLIVTCRFYITSSSPSPRCTSMKKLNPSMSLLALLASSWWGWVESCLASCLDLSQHSWLVSPRMSLQLNPCWSSCSATSHTCLLKPFTSLAFWREYALWLLEWSLWGTGIVLWWFAQGWYNPGIQSLVREAVHTFLNICKMQW